MLFSESLSDLLKAFDFNVVNNVFDNLNYRYKEFDGYHVLELALPGYSKDDVKIKYEKEKIIFSYEKLKSDTKKYYWKKEFVKEFVLKSSLDISQTTASFNDGILKVKFPILQEFKAREITIN